jgi:hypothetical protein
MHFKIEIEFTEILGNVNKNNCRLNHDMQLILFLTFKI